MNDKQELIMANQQKSKRIMLKIGLHYESLKRARVSIIRSYELNTCKRLFCKNVSINIVYHSGILFRRTKKAINAI